MSDTSVPPVPPNEPMLNAADSKYHIADLKDISKIVVHEEDKVRFLFKSQEWRDQPRFPVLMTKEQLRLLPLLIEGDPEMTYREVGEMLALLCRIEEAAKAAESATPSHLVVARNAVAAAVSEKAKSPEGAPLQGILDVGVSKNGLYFTVDKTADHERRRLISDVMAEHARYIHFEIREK